MTRPWRCYAWKGAVNTVRPDAESGEVWTSPEGAVEFLREALSAHGHYSKRTLVAALADLRRGESVTLHRALTSDDVLHLEVVPESA